MICLALATVYAGVGSAARGSRAPTPGQERDGQAAPSLQQERPIRLTVNAGTAGGHCTARACGTADLSRARRGTPGFGAHSADLG